MTEALKCLGWPVTSYGAVCISVPASTPNQGNCVAFLIYSHTPELAPE